MFPGGLASAPAGLGRRPIIAWANLYPCLGIHTLEGGSVPLNPLFAGGQV